MRLLPQKKLPPSYRQKPQPTKPVRHLSNCDKNGRSRLVFLAIIVLVTVFLLRQDAETTSKIADVFIIFMALQSLVIGLVLVILIVQLARLINLLQNEIKPIVESTNETVSTLRGTTQFLSDNLSEPVIRLNEYLAGLTEFFRILRPKRKKNPKE
jgi:hypothetical protein